MPAPDSAANSAPRFAGAWPEFFRDIGWPTVSRLTSRWVTVRGCRLHSRSSSRQAVAGDSGEAVPFLMLHGLVISSLYMIPLAEVIAGAGHEVHALDLPGFGRSEG